MANVYCIFEKLGLGGGGKIKAVYHRLNAIAENNTHTPVLLNINHDVHQRSVFRELVKLGKIAKGVHYKSVFDAAAEVRETPYPEIAVPVPDHDYKIVGKARTVYYRDGIVSGLDDFRKGETKSIFTRTLYDKGSPVRAIHVAEAKPVSITVTSNGNEQQVVNCAQGRPVSTARYVDGKFLTGLNFITGKSFEAEDKFFSSFVQIVTQGNNVTFIDGVTIPYSPDMIKGSKVLFLHADHKAPNGNFVIRAKHAVENFDGDAIVTATNVHKLALETDFVPNKPIVVLPHFCDQQRAITTQRKDLITVSRLDPVGKPIAECIEAFAKIADEFPDCNYLIYGEGTGRKPLVGLIKQLKMGGRVKLMGYTTDPMSVFSNAIASLYPTLTEGFGLAILESLSQDCPVLSYDVDYGPKEMIRNGVNGELVQPGNINQIAQAMRKILKNPEKYSAGCSDGLDNYSRKKYVENYDALVSSLTH